MHSASNSIRFLPRLCLQVQIDLYNLIAACLSQAVLCGIIFLGRGGRNKSRENPGIAKKGGGGLTPAKICLVDLT